MPVPRTSKERADASLAARLKPRLKADTARTKARLGELKLAAGKPGNLPKGVAAAFVAGVMDASPYLRSLILDDPARLAAILAEDPKARLDRIVKDAAAAWRDADEATLMTRLRLARQEVALITALADLGGVWDVNAVTVALTDFADAAVSAAICSLLSRAAAAGDVILPSPEKPDEACGWIVLGMGKFGAGELNYSSDIDLIVLFDSERARLGEGREPSTVFVKLTKRLVAILSERTEAGYVFRTDLRLRPDPGSTSIALSTEAALQYYESTGQNWERAALIKARPVAGDRASGDAFLRALTPYIWRKYLDYAAIADIHSIKRQIHDHRGHAEVAVAGHHI